MSTTWERRAAGEAVAAFTRLSWRRSSTAVERPRNWRKFKRAVFARHSNPWSAWTRWASAPVMLVPVWRRSWRDAALVGVWMAINPVVFGKPAHERAWATRAVLGEEQWIAERPRDTAMAVDIAATAAGLVAMVAARQRRAMPAAAATALEMGLLMAYWELMARYYDRNRVCVEVLDHDAGLGSTALSSAR